MDFSSPGSFAEREYRTGDGADVGADAIGREDKSYHGPWVWVIVGNTVVGIAIVALALSEVDPEVEAVPAVAICGTEPNEGIELEDSDGRGVYMFGYGARVKNGVAGVESDGVEELSGLNWNQGDQLHEA
ncbi:hypothetical protein EV360DRAFT_72641 [Lentinula raphanica]|nr:hypothetical protein EV360DRAFT_72641 [Lentinula raphanica]